MPPAPATGGGSLFDEVGAEISLGYDTDYIFRGVNFGDHLISGAINLDVPLSDMVGLSLGSWYGSLAESPYDELDLLAGLTFDLGAVELGIGATWYYFPDTPSVGVDGDAFELGASLGTSVGPVDLTVAYFYDFETEGSYIEAGASTSFEVNEWLSIEPYAAVAYNVDYYIDGDGWNHIALGLAFPISLTDTATLKPYVAGNLPLDVIEDTGADDEVVGGVSLSVSF